MRNEGRRGVKSNRVGRATLDDGVVTTAYRAVVAFECALCGRPIAPGVLFSRQTRRTPLHASIQTTGAMTTDPVCVTCRPLRLEDAGEDL